MRDAICATMSHVIVVASVSVRIDDHSFNRNPLLETARQLQSTLISLGLMIENKNGGN